MEQYLEQNQNREDTCKRQRWHKRGVETAPCVLEWTWPHSHVCGAPWRPGSQTLHFQTLFFLPYSPFPWSPLSFTSFFSFSSPLSLPSFSFGLDRLSRFVFLTITVVFPSARDICFPVLSLCMCQLSDISACPPLLPENPYAPSHFSHLVKKSPQSFSCILSGEGIWPMGCGLVPTRQISPLAVCPLLSSVSSSYRIPLRIIMPNTGISRAQVLATCSEWLQDLRGNENNVPQSYHFLAI